MPGDAEALQIAPAGTDGLYITGELQPVTSASRNSAPKPSACFRMVSVSAAPLVLLHTGEIDDFRGDGNLPSEVILFHDHDPVAGPGQVEGGGESRWPSSDDHDIVEICRPLHGLQLAHQV